jgi:putative membrane protein
LLALGAAACGRGQAPAGTTAAPPAAEAPPSAQPAPAPTPSTRLSAPEIGAVLSASDSAEILPSQLALKKSQNAEVKGFAQRMIKDHGMLEDSLRALERRQGLKPMPNTLSQQISTQTRSTMQQLQGLSGAQFDQAYVKAMVNSHQLALSTIDQQLIPSAQDPALRTALEQKVRPIVAGHLQSIQEIQRSLGYR